MFFVSRSVEQRNHAAPLFQPFDLPQQLLLVLQFFAVFLLEGSPFVGIVREPFAQSIGGRNVPQPQMDSSFVLGEPSGPQPVHQNADAVILFRWVVDSLDPDHGRSRHLSGHVSRMACRSRAHNEYTRLPCVSRKVLPHVVIPPGELSASHIPRLLRYGPQGLRGSLSRAAQPRPWLRFSSV